METYPHVSQRFFHFANTMMNSIPWLNRPYQRVQHLTLVTKTLKRCRSERRGVVCRSISKTFVKYDAGTKHMRWGMTKEISVGTIIQSECTRGWCRIIRCKNISASARECERAMFAKKKQKQKKNVTLLVSSELRSLISVIMVFVYSNALCVFYKCYQQRKISYRPISVTCK